MNDATSQTTDEAFCTVEEAATYLRASRSAIYSMVKRGDLPAIHVGRILRIPTAALRALAAQH